MNEVIKADMSANVWKVLVQVGDEVAPEQPMMILESMKMEIPVVSDDGGTVVAVHAAEGETVSAGAPLVELS